MSPLGREAEEETSVDVEPVDVTDREADEPEARKADVPSAPPAPPAAPAPTRPLPRRVPSQNPDRTGPTVSPPTDHTVRHLMNVLKRLP